MPTEDQAVHLLEELGLTEYEARCFVGLSRVRKATAKEISDLSGVPRSRVYDAVDRLHRRGLVDVQQSDPRQYKALPKGDALTTLRNQYSSTLEAANDALDGLRRSSDLEEEGAWAISDHEHVSRRIRTLAEDADDEIYALVADEDMIERRFCEDLAAASDGGVAVLVETATEDIAERIRDEVPSATVETTDLAGEPADIGGKWLGRIVMGDRCSILISAVSREAAPGVTEETAIWASGSDHGLVVGLRHLLGARIDGSDAFDGAD